MMYKNNLIAVVKCNGKILREKGSTVYLPFGSEYSILLKNEEARKAVVSIEVDGVNVLNNNKLIINGNTSQEIKGFMKNMSETNNFRFIHKTKEIQNHRGDKIEDGFIRISYQFEAIKQELLTFHAPKWGAGIYRYSNRHPYYTNGDFGEMLVGSSITKGTTSYNYCSTLDNAPHVEEGITVKGSKVNVPYTYGSTSTLENTTHIIVLQLKGETNSKCVSTPITVSTKVVCSICGRKNRSNNNFCYNCGTCLN